jgi:hypothetical protein
MLFTCTRRSVNISGGSAFILEMPIRSFMKNAFPPLGECGGTATESSNQFTSTMWRKAWSSVIPYSYLIWSSVPLMDVMLEQISSSSESIVVGSSSVDASHAAQWIHEGISLQTAQ